jgi:predicted nuclease of predicted toxin-antitoxin system
LQKHTESKPLRVLLDAQLSVRLFEVLSGLGFDVIHTSSLANKNRSTDSEILGVCEKDKRILFSKDRDFVDSFIVRNKPEKFLWINTGNISNGKLIYIFQKHHQAIKDLFELHFFVELTNEDLIIHQ